MPRAAPLALATLAALIPLAAAGRGAADRTSAARSPKGAAPTAQTPDTAALPRDIPRLLQASGVPGLSIAVVQDGRVTWERGFGTINDSARRPVDSATVFEAASLSKPVFAYLVLRHSSDGSIEESVWAR